MIYLLILILFYNNVNSQFGMSGLGGFFPKLSPSKPELPVIPKTSFLSDLGNKIQEIIPSKPELPVIPNTNVLSDLANKIQEIIPSKPELPVIPNTMVLNELNKNIQEILTSIPVIPVNPVLSDLGNKIQAILSSKPEFPNWNIKFYLFNKIHPNNKFILNFTSKDNHLLNSGFNPKLETKFIVQGFIGQVHNFGLNNKNWMMNMKDYILNRINCNVIIVDWADSSNYLITNSVLNIPVLGKMIAYFIERLINLTNETNIDIHCIGHSIGAHLCGHIGKSSKIRLAKITGLDPNWPLFDPKYKKSIPSLNANDANLVLVLHTSSSLNTSGAFNLAGAIGNPFPLGHYDFRPNGGNIQPMCGAFRKTSFGAIVDLAKFAIGLSFKDLTEAVYCSHNMAYVYPILEPVNGCQFIAFKCSNYIDFENGKCAEDGIPLEFNFDYYENSNITFKKTKLPNNMFIKTGGPYPYCLFHYQIVVEIEFDSNIEEIDMISLTLLAEYKAKISIDLSKKNKENIYYSLYTNNDELGNVTFAEYTKGQVKIKTLNVNYMSHLDKSVRETKSSRPKLVEIEDQSLTNWLWNKIIAG